MRGTGNSVGGQEGTWWTGEHVGMEETRRDRMGGMGWEWGQEGTWRDRKGHGGTGGDMGTWVHNQILRGTWVVAKRMVGQEGTWGDNQVPRRTSGLWVPAGLQGGVGGLCLSFPTQPYQRASSCPLGRQEGSGWPLMSGCWGFPSPRGGRGVPWVSPWSHLVGLHGPAQVLNPAVAFGQGRAPKGPAALARDDLGAGKVSGGGHPKVPGGCCALGCGCPWLRAVLGCPFGVLSGGALGAWAGCSG